MTTARAQRTAQRARAAIDRAAQHADGFDNAAPRRPINGHTADCPHRFDGPTRRCGLCRAEALEARVRRINGVPVPDRSVLAGCENRVIAITPTPATAVDTPLAACSAPACFRPTDHPSGQCDRCRQEATDA